MTTFSERNELMVSKRTDVWHIVEANNPGDFAKQTRAESMDGELLVTKPNKKAARDAAGKRMRTKSHPFMLLCSTKGRVSDVRWNSDYEAITIEPHEEGGWALKWSDGVFETDSNRGRLRKKAIEIQEEHGFRYVKIYRKDGSVYWQRQHPRWRRM